MDSNSSGNKKSFNRKVNLKPGAGGAGAPESESSVQLPGIGFDQPKDSIPRICHVCGSVLRVYTAAGGLRVTCQKCKRTVQIGKAARATALPPMGRGVKKETIVEPDWDRAFEDDDDMDSIVAPGYEEDDY